MFTVKYDSNYDYYSMVQDIKNAFERAPDYLPSGTDIDFIWERDYAFMVFKRHLIIIL